MTSSIVPNIDPYIRLSVKTTAMAYLSMISAKDRQGIANFIYDRFSERYITPLRSVSTGKDNGFLVMGVSCLLIEGITAFREGWPSTEGKSKKAFQLFFARESRFAPFNGIAEDFWKGVRCGILHQGETAKGWRLNFWDLNKPLFEPSLKRISCKLFFAAVEEVLGEYRDELVSSDWDSTIWNNFRSKMDQTVKDCAA